MTPDQLYAVIDSCIQRGAAVAVDAEGDALRPAADRALWAVKVNRGEFADLAGRTINADAELIACGRARSAGIGTLLVSCGDGGGYLFTGQKGFRGWVDVDPSRVVSTVSCGDCLLAGFVAGHLRAMPPCNAFRYALAVATAAAGSTEPGTFEPAAVDDLYPKTAVAPV
jgi:fructose-1-phosphate kinase PfkB-like protein